MPTILEIRQQYPQYNDMSDADLAGALHQKFYSDMPQEQFNAKIGFDPNSGNSASAPNTQATAPQPPASEPGIAGSIDAFGRGIANAATFGFADEIGAGLDYAGSHMFPWRDPKTYDQALSDTRASDNAVAGAHPVASIAGNVTGAIGAGNALAGAGLSATARAADAGRGLWTTSAASALDGAAVGGAQGFGQGEGGWLNRLKSGQDGAITGGVIGAALPLAVTGAINGFRRTVSPLTANPQRQALVQSLANEGIDVTAGQAMGSKGLRYAEGEIGGQAAQDITDRQGLQFTAAALRRAGVTANRATPDVIDQAFTNIGNRFEGLAARNTLVADRQLQNDLVGAWGNYMQMTPESARAPIVANMMRDINDAIRNNGNTLDGAAYQSVSSRLERAARNTKDPELAGTLRDMRAALDDGMERSISANNPGDLGGWQDARSNYRNMLVLEKAATGAGEDAAQGIISPSALRAATVSKQGVRNYARGNGDFADLARAGEGVMKPLPNSGTAGRIRAQNLGTTFMGALGGIGGTMAGGPVAGVASAVAGAAIPQIVGRMMMSAGGQAYLRNQLMSGTLNPQTRSGLIQAINQIDGNFIPRILGQDERQPLEITVTPREMPAGN